MSQTRTRPARFGLGFGSRIVVGLLAAAVAGCGTARPAVPGPCGEASAADDRVAAAETSAPALQIATSFDHAGMRWILFVDDAADPERGVLTAWPADTEASAVDATDTPLWTSPIYDLWWAAPARLEADATQIVLGMWSERQRHRSQPPRHRTVRVVEWNGRKLVDRWRGSALARPMIAFSVRDVDGDGIDELLVDEVPPDDSSAPDSSAPDSSAPEAPAVHRWTGFGFSRD